LAEAGLGPAEALRAATLTAAEALGLAGELGVIAPGALADLVLLDGNPLDDIRYLRRVRAVLAGGRLATLDQLLGF
jgi:imidazolonepropionase-like amidohydrolase